MKHPNKLINEQSPYLLQHAYNPVDWYPWCKEAFEKAAKENKPIFLSIGYSTCHWCHVMEKESFEDEEVAKLMNEVFVSIKVDREERPDIDNIYMTICQMMTGSGGWPLTIIMTADKKPFFAGTYFPKKSRFGRIGMLELIPKINEVWKEKQNEIINASEDITNSLISSSKFTKGSFLSEDIVLKCFDELIRRYDTDYGGFGKAPKFPTPHVLTFLLRFWKRHKNDQALQMVEKTLTQMRLGGIYDQIGFGFHRYSTDQYWLVPHFEKMLYDQALLVLAYSEAYQATKNILFKETAEEIIQYVKRDLTSSEGGFYSAEDADSEGEEGKFYLWTLDEITKILDDGADLLIDIFNMHKDGNWFDPMHSNKTGNNILHLKVTLKEYATKRNLSMDQLKNNFSSACKKLFEARRKRIHPHKDDKILTDWNGLMISAFAKASQIFGEKYYAEFAELAVDFVLSRLTLSNGRLLHRFRNGKADISGNLDDYAFFIAALLDVYEATFKTFYLERAVDLQNDLIKYFWDEDNGGFFFTAFDSEVLLVRQKQFYDGAVPSGNSIALMNLVRLFCFTGNRIYYEYAENLIKVVSNTVKQFPSNHTQFLSGFDFYLGPSKEIILVGENNVELDKFLEIINEFYLPNKIIMIKYANDNGELSKIAEFTLPLSMIDNKTTLYVCEDFSCKLPITSESELEKQLA